jgi:hypothetical protein
LSLSEFADFLSSYLLDADLLSPYLETAIKQASPGKSFNFLHMGTIYILNEVLCSCHRVFDPDHPDMIEPYLDDYINNNASEGGENCASERGVNAVQL